MMTSKPDAPNASGSLELTVAEASPRDAYRGVIRIDPEDMKRIGVDVGDVVMMTGESAAVGRALPAFPQDRGRGLALMDGILRLNAGAAIGDTVSATATETERAARVTCEPVGGQWNGANTRHIARLIEGLPLLVGNRFRVTRLGSNSQEFLVKSTVPTGPVVTHSETTVESLDVECDGDPSRVAYEDIGGLRRELRRIREMIELPLRHPEVFARLGIEPPKGILLHGPPGTGKTLIARVVASEAHANFFSINGPEIVHKFYGESEARLREIFEKAEQQAPSILFIDEIDAIAPKREKVVGDVEKRIVAQLLALMDGLASRGRLVVIGATNIPDSLDPALRRPGRFDREIAIGAPDVQGRLEILQVHTRGMPLADDVSLERLADVTHGFVGADLAALTREAAMAAVRRHLTGGAVSEAELALLCVIDADFREAFRECGPSAIREVFAETPNATWEDVGGLDEARERLMEALTQPLRYREWHRELGVRAPKGILLYGPPGTGKTLVAKALARESGVNFISVRGPELLSMWVGESERGIRQVFRTARQAAPCLVFLDEIDTLAPRRLAGGTDNGVVDRVVGTLLNELDGIEELRGVTALAATNRKDMIDPALLRAGRFDAQIALPLPSESARRAIFEVHTRRLRVGEADTLLGELARKTEGFTGADIESLCQRAAYAALGELIAQRGDAPVEDQPALPATVVEQRHFNEELARLQREREGDLDS